MFDLGFTELIVIGVVALVVLGPERMPEVARAAGRFFAKAQSYISQVKGEFERESQLAEIKKIRDELSSSAAGLPPLRLPVCVNLSLICKNHSPKRPEMSPMLSMS